MRATRSLTVTTVRRESQGTVHDAAPARFSSASALVTVTMSMDSRTSPSIPASRSGARLR